MASAKPEEELTINKDSEVKNGEAQETSKDSEEEKEESLKNGESSKGEEGAAPKSTEDPETGEEDKEKEESKDNSEDSPGETTSASGASREEPVEQSPEKKEKREAEGKALEDQFQEMSDGSSGDENSRPWRLSPEHSWLSPDSPRLSPETSRPSRETPKGSSESARHSPKISRPSPKTTRSQLKDKRVGKIRRHRTQTRYSVRDTEEYRAGYPDKADYPYKKDNLRFYTNQIPSRPRGDYIDAIHKDWFGDYGKLEQHHGYIQWLFPIREDGMNREAQELQLHEAEAIKKDPEAYARVMRSYKLMLDFFGMRVKDEKTGELERGDNWQERFTNLRIMRHNHLRITRILKCLGELGYEYLKPCFMRFVLQEILQKRTLASLLDSALDFWVHTLRDEDQRREILDYASQFVENVN